MHVYSSDNRFRPVIIAVLGVLAFSVTYAVSVFLVPHVNAILPWEPPILLVGGIAFGPIFGSIFYIFSHYLWNHSWTPQFLVPTPDLTGHWEGYIITSYSGEIDDKYLYPDHGELMPQTTSGNGQAMTASLDVNQNWRTISVHFGTGRSESNSTAVSIQSNMGIHPKLSYLFQNTGPQPVEMAESEGTYNGAAHFSIRDEGDRLLGRYYTGPARASRDGEGDELRTSYGSAELLKIDPEPQK